MAPNKVASELESGDQVSSTSKVVKKRITIKTSKVCKKVISTRKPKIITRKLDVRKEPSSTSKKKCSTKQTSNAANRHTMKKILKASTQKTTTKKICNCSSKETSSKNKQSTSKKENSNNATMNISNKLSTLIATKECRKSKNVVDPILDKIDPKPDIQKLFLEFDRRFFKGLLKKNKVTVQWSRRLKSSVGMCRDEYPPLITLSEPLLKLRPRRDTVETLLHEMIHAYLAVAPGQFENEMHGPKFHQHMKRIDRLAGTKLKVDHDFYDEMDVYRYVWMCNGKCKKEVSSCYNKPPGTANGWWNEHRKSCGGIFILINVPKDEGKNKK